MPEETDHDLLVRLDERMGRIMKWIPEHESHVDARFEKIHDRMNGVDKKVDGFSRQKIVERSYVLGFLGLGGLIAYLAKFSAFRRLFGIGE